MSNIKIAIFGIAYVGVVLYSMFQMNISEQKIRESFAGKYRLPPS
jgi:hypothetical protein